MAFEKMKKIKHKKKIKKIGGKKRKFPKEQKKNIQTNIHIKKKKES